jgi:hypothetical protein
VRNRDGQGARTSVGATRTRRPRGKTHGPSTRTAVATTTRTQQAQPARTRRRVDARKHGDELLHHRVQVNVLLGVKRELRVDCSGRARWGRAAGGGEREGGCRSGEQGALSPQLQLSPQPRNTSVAVTQGPPVLHA